MNIISKMKVLEWCRSNSISLDQSNRPISNSKEENFSIPLDSGHRVAMVKTQFHLFDNDDEILVWFTDWSVWESGERKHIFDRLRQSYGENRSLIDSPGHLFLRNEFEDALDIIILGVLFLWDVYVLNRCGNKLLFYSHDEFGYTSMKEAHPVIRDQPVKQKKMTLR